MYGGVCFHNDSNADNLGKKFNIKGIERDIQDVIFAGLNLYGGN
jgi:hypothetical protein